MDVYIAENVSSMGADGYRVQRIVMMQLRPEEISWRCCGAIRS